MTDVKCSECDGRGNASLVQRAETERAFYAGAGAMFDAVDRSAGTGDEEPTDEELQAVADLEHEIQQWIADHASARGQG